jgi:hypothetical protein
LARPRSRSVARSRNVRLATVAVVWLAGLAAGFFALLSAAAKYGCGGSDDGLACHTSGSLLGVLLVVLVIAVVTAVTVLSDDRASRSVLILGAAGLAALLICFVAARMLLDTV